jgi:glycosyltransferase involved in cell wall biosynthesis/ADP-heptose:LPS heptosyltransferase
MKKTRKLKLLSWCDSPLSITGFGVVAKNLLGRIHGTGEFDVACVGINHFDEHVEKAFEDRREVPYRVFIGTDAQQGPNGTIQMGDRMGRGKTVQMIRNGQLDVFWMMRDLWDMIVPGNNFETFFPLHIQLAKESGKNFRVVSHFPLEYQLQGGWTQILDQMDYGYCFTKGGMPQLEPYKGKIEWCPQGADGKIYRKLEGFNKTKFRAEKMGLKDPNCFLVLNVNRNQPRKDIDTTLKAFKKFKDSISGTTGPRPVLWLHMRPDDNFGDARQLVSRNGLVVDHDVQFPAYFNVGAGWTEEELNMVYNAADVFISTAVAEGFGLTCVEAGMAGLPALVPGHTGFLQTMSQLGMPYIKCGPKLNSEGQQQRWGTVVSESEVTLTDPDDMAAQLITHYKNPKLLNNQIRDNIKQFRKTFDWDEIFKKYWVPLLETVQEDIFGTELRQARNKDRILFVCEEAFGDVLGATKALEGLRKVTDPCVPIDFMTKKKFKDVVEGNPNITLNLDWNLNTIFDYPSRQVLYPHCRIRHGGWANGHTHLLDMQAEMIGVVPGKVYIKEEPFDHLLPEIIKDDAEVLPIITINTTSQAGKMIVPEKWMNIMQSIGSRFPFIRFMLVGGPNDMLIPGTIDMRFEPGTDKPLSYRKMAWLQKKALCHIGIDSGPGHSADAVETPSIIVWGWTNPLVCKPQNYSINIVPHFPSVCPAMGACHGVSPRCGVNQYHPTDGMRAPCAQSIDPSLVSLIVIQALEENTNLIDAKQSLRDRAKKKHMLYILPQKIADPKVVQETVTLETK